ncbi:MAG: hypothetical protein IPH93_17270 [Saprospiraceae bacterium]|nr:hypothetical protein [Saprospiraceae bacterium]
MATPIGNDCNNEHDCSGQRFRSESDHQSLLAGTFARGIYSYPLNESSVTPNLMEKESADLNIFLLPQIQVQILYFYNLIETYQRSD